MDKIKYTSVSWLKKNEQRAINETIAMMSYNPSIGRVLKPGGVIKFKEIAIRKIKLLENIRNQFYATQRDGLTLATLFATIEADFTTRLGTEVQSRTCSLRGKKGKFEEKTNLSARWYHPSFLRRNCD